MMRKILRNAFVLSGVFIFTVPALAADAERGKVVAEVRCMPCHHLNQASRSVGPTLKGIYNRAPTITGVPFKRWDAAALDAWLSGPRKIKPNSRMTVPPIVKRDREDLIAYFKRDEKSD
jgi:cytochrome c